METNLIGQLEKLPTVFGIDQAVIVVVTLIVAASFTAVRGLHVLTTGWHTRRREFFEMYERMPHESPDPLALETAFRHGFGLWIPVATIHLIRKAPSPSAPLIGLMTMMRFLDVNYTDGKFVVKPMFSTRIRRALVMTAYAAAFLVCSYALAFSLLFILNNLQGSNLLPYAVILILSALSGAFFMGTGFDLWALRSFVERHPYIFNREEERSSAEITTSRSSPSTPKSSDASTPHQAHRARNR